jgi:hypothetical protein
LSSAISSPVLKLPECVAGETQGSARLKKKSFERYETFFQTKKLEKQIEF